MHAEDDLIYVEEAFSIGVRGDVLVLVWRGRPTRDRLARNADAGVAIARRVRARALVVVIESRSPPPELWDLAFAAQGLDRLAPGTFAAVVLEDRDATALVLEALARVHQLMRNRVPAKFCSDAGEAASWLAPRLGEPRALLAADLDRVIEEVRARLDAGTAHV